MYKIQDVLFDNNNFEWNENNGFISYRFNHSYLGKVTYKLAYLNNKNV